MEITAIITILGIVPLFLWNRAESRAHYRHTESKLESTRELVRAIHDEIKDFHEQLINIRKNENK
jgi:septation ring formation regulator EzrA